MKKEIWLLRLIPVYLAALTLIVLAVVVTVGRKSNEEMREIVEEVPMRVIGGEEDAPNVTEDVKPDPEPIKPPDAVEQPIRVEAEVTDPVTKCADRIGDLFTAYFNDLGLPVTSYNIAECYEMGENTQVYVSFDNTNAYAYCIVSPDGELLEYDYPSPMYGSDYAMIYFTQGVPENIREIEDSVYEHGVFDCCVSDYAGGSSIELVIGRTQEHVIVDLE